MVIKGTLTITTDINLAAYTAASYQNTRVLYIADTGGTDIKSINPAFVSGIALVPDYQTLSYAISGDYQAFTNAYTNYLNGETPAAYIAAILAALMQGIDIVFYFPPDTVELQYPKFMMDFLVCNFGIMAASESTQFAYNHAYDDTILNFIYLNDAISAAEFLYMSENVDQQCLYKLIYDYHLCPETGFDMDINEYINILKEKKALMRNQRKVLSPMCAMEA